MVILNVIICHRLTLPSPVVLQHCQELSPPSLLALIGVSSVLTMATLGTFSRKNFPRVSYLTALDFYIAICFVLCFCTLLEFTVLNFLTYNNIERQASPKFYQVRTTCWYGKQNFRLKIGGLWHLCDYLSK